MLTIYGMADSGNCYKPRLLMALLNQPFRHVGVSFLDGGTQDPSYLAKNPLGKVPLAEFDDGRRLPESNAILCYLAEGTSFLPGDPFQRAQALSWMFFEQYDHEPSVAVRRSLLRYPSRARLATPERLAALKERGDAALGIMNMQLSYTDWLVGDAPSVADIALYAYTHVAEEGGFDLSGFPGVARWLARVEALPGYRPLDWLPAG